MSRRGLAFLCLLFFLSGACALIYQVMWLRLLALVFGVTVYAASTVLSAFMAGLALGNLLAGRWAPSLRFPLAAFGAVELGIGLTALATPAAIDGLKAVWVALTPSLPEGSGLLTAARLAGAFAVLLVPTTLMGATMPLVVGSAIGRSGGQARLGLLYAVNTAGAVVGALVAGFYLIANIGVSASFSLAAALNLLVGVAAIAASRLGRAGTAQTRSSEGEATIAPAAEHALTDRQRRLVLYAFGVSGLVSLALEVIWFRMLVILLRPTAYAFTIMLASVLVGIAVGSALVTPLLRRQWPWFRVLAVLQLTTALTALLSFNALAHNGAVLAALEPWLSNTGLDPYLVPLVVASSVAMLPTTVLFGTAFPVGLLLWTRGGRSAHVSGRVGLFYSINLIGAIAGSLIAGFVLLPLLGSRISLIVAAAAALATGVAIALQSWRHSPNFAGFAALVGPTAFVMIALNTVDPFTANANAAERVLWRDEGIQTTVAVHERRTARQPMRVMYLDGMHQANDSPQSAFVHHRIGALPVFLHPNPRRALVVGMGGGATPGALARYPGIEVDVVELSPEVVRGAEFFRHVNFDLLQRPSVTVRVDDGRNYLMTSGRKYDVITADIILPRHAGAGALYSQEYFTLVRNALNDGGLALQWIGSEGATEYKLIMRTFLSVFPETTLWGDGSLMVGSLQPFTLSAATLEARRQDPEFRALFDWDLATMKRLYLAGPAALKQFVGDGPVLRDDKPVIEYFLSLPQNDPPADLSGLKGDFAEVLRP